MLSITFHSAHHIERQIIFLGIYIFAAPITGAVNQTDINNLRAMFSGLGIISKLINIPLGIMKKIAAICARYG